MLALCVSCNNTPANNADTSADSSTDETAETTEITTNENGETVTSGTTDTETNTSTGDTTTSDDTTTTTTEEETVPAFEASITFNGDTATVSDTEAVAVSGKNYKIVKAGIYTISGTMNDGQIQVEVADTDRVTLLLSNFTGSCSDSAVIYVINADKVYIDLEKDSVNTVTDSSMYIFPDPLTDKPNACIYSADDMTIKGGGTLNVTGSFNNGIGCKNDLDIKNGVVNVTAVKNAVKGNDSVNILGDAVVNILGAKDGIKADTIDKPGKGFVLITEMAQVNVTCTSDAIQAYMDVTITTGATVTVNAATTPVKCDGTTNIDNGCLITK